MVYIIILRIYGKFGILLILGLIMSSECGVIRLIRGPIDHRYLPTYRDNGRVTQYSWGIMGESPDRVAVLC